MINFSFDLGLIFREAVIHREDIRSISYGGGGFLIWSAGIQIVTRRDARHYFAGFNNESIIGGLRSQGYAVNIR